MTEKEWLECADPEPMLHFLRGNASDRKLRLLGVACCRRIWHLLIDERSKNAVLTVERYADLLTGLEEVAVAFNDSEIAFRACEYITDRHAGAAGAAHDLTASCGNMIEKAVSIALATAHASGYLNDESFFAYQEDVQVEYPPQCSLINDIFGNPFRPITINPRWLTSTVVDLATAIYEERAFDRMPILGDALMDAGCDNEEIIAHCRGEGPHVRGCWVVDLLTGRE